MSIVHHQPIKKVTTYNGKVSESVQL